MNTAAGAGRSPADIGHRGHDPGHGVYGGVHQVHLSPLQKSDGTKGADDAWPRFDTFLAFVPFCPCLWLCLRLCLWLCLFGPTFRLIFVFIFFLFWKSFLFKAPLREGTPEAGRGAPVLCVCDVMIYGIYIYFLFRVFSRYTLQQYVHLVFSTCFPAGRSALLVTTGYALREAYASIIIIIIINNNNNNDDDRGCCFNMQTMERSSTPRNRVA